MFIGEYNHSVDTKGRVSLPSRFREDISETFYITTGFEGCLVIYDEAQWHVMEKRLDALNFAAKEARAFKRAFYARAMELSCDKQGRFLIPPQLRSFAGINKEVTIIGVSNYIELWDKATWEEYNASGALDMGALSEALGTDNLQM